MMPSLPYALLLSVAVLSASFAGKRAFAVGGVLAAGWVLYTSAWGPYAPAGVIGMSPTDIWAATDMLMGAAVLYLGRYNWWAFAIWGLLTMQMMLHCVFQFNGLEFATYSAALDALFLGQVAVLLMAGGPASVVYLFDCLRRAGNVLRQAMAASRQAKPQA